MSECEILRDIQLPKIRLIRPYALSMRRVQYVLTCESIMNEGEEALHQFVLNTIADDYESFEIVWEHVRRWAAERAVSVGPDSVVETLERAVREGDAQAYLLSPHPPHSQPIDFSRDRIDDLWFYLTPKGKRTIAGP